MKFRHALRAARTAAAILLLPLVVSPAAADSFRDALERGRYIARIGGCNDGHTAGYAEKGGRVPEADWLKGDTLGYRGAWGTTYPSNLRLYLGTLTEDEWVRRARTQTARPPMPWFALRDMSEQDLRAFYRFVRSLGPAGVPAPAYLPPDRKPPGPVVAFPGARP